MNTKVSVQASPTKAGSPRQVVTWAIFLVLIASRMLVTGIDPIRNELAGLDSGSGLIQWLGHFQSTAYDFFWKGSFILLAIVILINHDELPLFNIDKPFVVIFIVTGLIVCFISLPEALATLVAVVVIFQALRTRRLTYGNSYPWLAELCLLILSGFVLAWLALSRFIQVSDPNKLSALFSFPVRTFTVSVFEEVLYRGIFWMVLKKMSWSGTRIVLATSLLFWISHTQYLFAMPYAFWITTPLVSILFGFLVHRSRSITPSTLAHILYNLTIELLR